MADYGDIGPTLAHSHGTGDAAGTLAGRCFKEFALRGEAQNSPGASWTPKRAELSGQERAGWTADVRDALLDIASSQQQVQVARSSVELANEALSEAQQRLCQRRERQPGSEPGRAVPGTGPMIDMSPASTGTTWPSSA